MLNLQRSYDFFEKLSLNYSQLLLLQFFGKFLILLILPVVMHLVFVNRVDLFEIEV